FTDLLERLDKARSLLRELWIFQLSSRTLTAACHSKQFVEHIVRHCRSSQPIRLRAITVAAQGLRTLRRRSAASARSRTFPTSAAGGRVFRAGVVQKEHDGELIPIPRPLSIS